MHKGAKELCVDFCLCYRQQKTQNKAQMWFYQMLLAVNHTLNNNFDATTNGAQHGILTLKYLLEKKCVKWISTT